MDVSTFSVPFSPILLKASPTSQWASLLKLAPNKAGDKPEPVCLLVLLQFQTWAQYLWVSINILRSTFCTLCLKASALAACLPPCRSFFHCLCLLVCLCVWRVLWNSVDKEEPELFSALNEIWQLECAVQYAILIYPPNWKAREEFDAVEGSAVCVADLGQLSCSKMFSVYIVRS